MLVLTNSQLQQIRTDPASIQTIYQSVSSSFAASLHMSGLPDDALKAAFCCVAAYELAPYGPEPSTYDLGVLLASPTLACDDYVTLAWRLIEQFGISTDNQAAVGWDSGAVGNHAQMLLSVGGANLLLDPTIGLVVNGVTLDGLINGVHYTQMASYFERPELAGFNDTVIQAVSNGLYKVYDAIYYVPKLINWTEHYDDYLGLRVDNADGTHTIVGFIDDDNIVATDGNDIVYGGRGNDTIHLSGGNDIAHGGVGNDTIYADSGNNILYGDAGNDTLIGGPGVDTAAYSGNYASYALTYNSAGSYAINGQDGSDTLKNIDNLSFSDHLVPLIVSTIKQSDVANVYAWSDVTYGYDWLGKTMYVGYNMDDGSHINYNYDTTNTFSWSRITTYTDSAQHATLVNYDMDNGSHILYEYDINNKFDFSQIMTTNTSSNQTQTIQYFEDDKSHWLYEYDIGNSQTWSSIETHSDVNYKAISVMYNNDNGTHTLYSYASDGSGTWANYDAAWHMLGQQHHFAGTVA